MKRLIICSDGTWNKPDQLDREVRKPSNVVKIARAILPQTDNIFQIVYYDEGVGSSNWVADKLLGGFSGVGITKNICDGYRFLSHNYTQGDEIFLFGFSRGAYTVRSLAGFLNLVGLLPKKNIFFLEEAFNYYRQPNVIQRVYSNRQRGTVDMTLDEFREENEITTPKIKFVGVWDTVGSLGIPVGFFQRKFGKKHQFHDTTLGKNIENAYQALAIDEKRKPFAPTLWELEPNSGQTLDQQWFAGVHTNIGGGYDNDGLANCALHWIKENAEKHGLRFNDKFLAFYKPYSLDEMRNSFKFPFSILGKNHRKINNSVSSNEKIHPTALDRLNNLSSYKPENLPKP